MEDVANTGVMHMHVSSSHLSLYIVEAIWTGMFSLKYYMQHGMALMYSTIIRHLHNKNSISHYTKKS